MSELNYIQPKLVPIILMQLVKALGYKIIQQSSGGYGKPIELHVKLVKAEQ